MVEGEGTVIAFGVKCPCCASSACFRVHRSILLRLFPFSRLYRCKDCESSFVLLLGLLSVRLFRTG